MTAPAFDGSGLRLVLGLGLLLWAVIGVVYVYFAEPQWQYHEQRVSSKPDTAEVIYFAFECLNEDCSLRRCAHFAERAETAKGDSFFIKPKQLSVAFATGLPSPEDTDLAVDGNYFFMTGYRYQGQETNFLTGATRQASPPYGLRFDVLAWEVKPPYSVVRTQNESEESTVRNDVLDEVRYELPGADHAPNQFIPVDMPSCMPLERRRREP